MDGRVDEHRPAADVDGARVRPDGLLHRGRDAEGARGVEAATQVERLLLQVGEEGAQGDKRVALVLARSGTPTRPW